MKRLLITAILLLTAAAWAMVGEGKPQRIRVERDAAQKLVIKSDDGRSFPDIDACAKHCYQRSSMSNPKSEWANQVDILCEAELTAEDRQYIGDRLVANKVYPDKMKWKEAGKTNTAVYQPDARSTRPRRELK